MAVADGVTQTGLVRQIGMWLPLTNDTVPNDTVTSRLWVKIRGAIVQVCTRHARRSEKSSQQTHSELMSRSSPWLTGLSPW